MSRLATFIASGAGVGYAPVASGTFGTALAVPLAATLALLADRPWLQALVLVAAILVAIWAAGAAAGESGVADPSFVVVDEIVGFFVTVAFLPFTVPVVVAGFFAFRFFDIWKPAPIARLERLPGGLGIVADDLAAGLAAHVLLRLATAAGWL